MTSTAPSALILGTLHGQNDAIEWLQQAGWTAYACGDQKVGPGVDTADEFFLVDITNADAVEELCARLGVDVVYSVGSDIAMPTIARVSERLGLPLFHSSELIEVLHRKANLRAFLQQHDLNGVAFGAVTGDDRLAGFDSFPAIVKPSDSQGQRGITIVNTIDEADRAIAHAQTFSSTNTAVIEEFLDGPEVSVHVFVVGGKVEFALPSDRILWDGPVVGFPQAHRLPATFLGQHAAALDDIITRTVSALGVQTGPLYFQLILTNDGPRIVEIAPRLDGCHLWRLVEEFTGVNLIARCFELLSGGAWEPVAPATGTDSHELTFMLSHPDEPFDPTSWDDVQSHFREIQLAPGERPRAINPHVARVGYRIDVAQSGPA